MPSLVRRSFSLLSSCLHVFIHGLQPRIATRWLMISVSPSSSSSCHGDDALPRRSRALPRRPLRLLLPYRYRPPPLLLSLAFAFVLSFLLIVLTSAPSLQADIGQAPRKSHLPPLRPSAALAFPSLSLALVLALPAYRRPTRTHRPVSSLPSPPTLVLVLPLDPPSPCPRSHTIRQAHSASARPSSMCSCPGANEGVWMDVDGERRQTRRRPPSSYGPSHPAQGEGAPARPLLGFTFLTSTVRQNDSVPVCA